MKDMVLVFGTVMAMEVIDHSFGRAVGMAVAVTAFVGCIIFLWHEGAKAIEARRTETNEDSVPSPDESAVGDSRFAQKDSA